MFSIHSKSGIPPIVSLKKEEFSTEYFKKEEYFSFWTRSKSLALKILFVLNKSLKKLYLPLYLTLLLL